MRVGEGTGGISLAEALVSLLIGLLLLHLSLTSMARMRAVQSRVTSRAEFVGSMRLFRAVVRGELRLGIPGRDELLEADSLSLRAFRGTAVVCRRESPTEYLVSFRGYRAPDTSKDSVLAVGSLGQTEVVGLLSGRPVPDRCDAGAGGSAAVWLLDRELRSAPVILRLFERGSYHLARLALRYRSGRGGRQPLTPEVLATPASRWTRGGDSYRVELVPLDSTSSASWIGYLAPASTR